MEPKWKADWDYFGWRKYSDLLTTQDDWNRTLLTQINFVAHLMWTGTKRVSGEIIKVNSNMYKVFEALEYLHVANVNGEANITLARYKVIIDETIPDNKIMIYGDDKNYAKILEAYPTAVLVMKYEETSTETGIATISFLFEGDAMIDELREIKGVRIITPDMLVGEITVLNI